MAEEFKIEDQYPITMLNQRGNIEDGMRVIFTSYPSMVRGQVDVPLNRYSAENVRSQVLYLRKQIEETHAL